LPSLKCSIASVRRRLWGWLGGDFSASSSAARCRQRLRRTGWRARGTNAHAWRCFRHGRDRGQFYRSGCRVSGYVESLEATYAGQAPTQGGRPIRRSPARCCLPYVEMARLNAPGQLQNAWIASLRQCKDVDRIVSARSLEFGNLGGEFRDLQVVSRHYRDELFPVHGVRDRADGNVPA
jgi:hypothetical protein